MSSTIRSPLQCCYKLNSFFTLIHVYTANFIVTIIIFIIITRAVKMND